MQHELVRRRRVLLAVQEMPDRIELLHPQHAAESAYYDRSLDLGGMRHADHAVAQADHGDDLACPTAHFLQAGGAVAPMQPAIPPCHAVDQAPDICVPA